MSDLARFRSLFSTHLSRLFLNHASEAPVLTTVRERIETYLTEAAFDPDSANGRIGEVRELLSRLMGGSPAEYAIVPNTGIGIGMVAGGIDWRPGDNVVVPAEEYPANVYPWLTLRDRGVEVRQVPLDGYRVTPGAVADLVDERTRVLAVSAVEYLSGFRCDLPALGRIAHAKGALFVVDGIQACGAVPINVDDEGIDVLVSGGYKWLLGPIGTGMMYIRRGVWDQVKPILPGARSSVLGVEDAAGEFTLLDTAQRYETGCLPFSLLAGWTAGLETLLDAGIGPIHRQLLMLTDHLAAGLRAKGFEILSPMATEGERSGIVVFTTGSVDGNKALAERLYKQGIIIAFRGGRCRVSPSFYDTLDEINQFLEAL